MLLETLSQSFRKARRVNQTSNGFVSKIPTPTEPSGDAGTATGGAVFDLANPSAGGTVAQNSAIILPYAIGVNNNTFSVRIIGWRVTGMNAETALWIPVVLAELAVTISSTPIGAAGKDVLDTELFADTITLTTGNANVSIDVNSPADNTIAHVVVDLKGFQKLELSFTTGASATSCNALLALL